MATKRNETIWHFDVSDPQLHPKGFTIYKVTCKVFPISRPEKLTEVVIWKRYNDFKQLHKAMLSLHRALHRRDEFPVFAKPKLFGRFDDTVIEERRLSALSLLNFIGEQAHLYKSKAFDMFLQGGKITQGLGESPVLHPTRLDILSGDRVNGNPPPDVVPVIVPSSQTPHGSEPAAPPSHDTVLQPTQSSSSLSVNDGDQEQRILEGTWNYPQPPDTISLDSSASFGEAGDTDIDSPLGTSLPETDLSLFDPLTVDKGGELEPGMTRSNSWLVTALHTCAQLGEQDTNLTGQEDERQTDSEEPAVIETLQTDFIQSVEKEDQAIGHSDVTFDIGEFDPLRPRGESKIEVGKGDIDLSLESTSLGSMCSLQFPSQSGSLSTSSPPRTDSLSDFNSPDHKPRSLTASPAHKPGSWITGSSHKPRSLTASPAHKIGSASSSPARRSDMLSSTVHRMRSNTPSPASKNRSSTHSSVSSMDLGGKDDYIYLAAHQICLAQEHEANANYEMSFTCYKTGVGILLQGVQEDSNKSRRDAVRRKTAQYLMKAEDLYNRYMAQEAVDERRWASTDITLSPSLELDPSLAFMRSPLSEMRNYKVLGTVGRVVLVMEKNSDETYVIKTIHKAAVMPTKYVSSVMPTTCPYMASLYKFYETQNAIYLLLQYASGGKLWTYISGYMMEHDAQTGACDSPQGLYPQTSKNVYTGQKFETMDEILQESSDSRNASSPVSSTPAKPSSRISIGPGSSTGRTVHFSNQIKSPEEEAGDSLIETPPKKPDYSRLSSLSSDEGKVAGEAVSPSVCSDSDQNFQEVLGQTVSSMEQFSINSIDSDNLSRIDSNVSDHIECIPEEASETATESSPIQSGGTANIPDEDNNDDAFQSDSQDVTSPSISEADLSLDAQRIVKSSKELIKLVDRVLSESDSFDGVQTVDSVTKNDELLDKPEPSIYDCHHSNSSDTSDHESDVKPAVVSPCSDTTESTSSANTTDAVQVPVASPIHSSVSKKLSLTRMNSKDLTRSASFECDLKSPTKNRARAMSDLFNDLDARNPETLKLPEPCIKTWAAEIVSAVSHLHALGVICRDLHPENILLGEKGHIMLTYFYQLGHLDKQLDVNATEQLYVAPEVRSINGFTEVCDWWSLGTLLYELLTGKSLVSFHPGGFTSHTQLHIPSHVSPEGQALLRELLCYDPRERLGSGLDGSEALKTHPFFTDINWNDVENV